MFPFIMTVEEYYNFDNFSDFLSQILGVNVQYREINEHNQTTFSNHYTALFYVGRCPSLNKRNLSKYRVINPQLEF